MAGSVSHELKLCVPIGKRVPTAPGSRRFVRWAAECRCGESSPILGSDYEARIWHESHKAAAERREALDARYGAEAPF